jgi:hypothetical protein
VRAYPLPQGCGCRRRAGLAALAVAVGLLLSLSGGAEATTYGLKSADYYGSKGQVSGAPTRLFSFAENGSGLTDLGTVKLNGTSSMDADGLAISPMHGLLAFQLTEANDAQGVPRDSRLVSIDPLTARATAIGGWLDDVDVRGAVFDLSDTLWAVDARGNCLLTIDPATGAVTGSPLGLTLGGAAFDVPNGADLAVRTDGTFYLAAVEKIYALNPATGELVEKRTDAGLQLAGVAFSLAAPGSDDLFAFEVNGTDDLLRYDADSAFARTVLRSNIIPAFNAGRGDLAALIIPEPVTMAGLALGIGSLATYLRRRSKT